MTTYITDIPSEYILYLDKIISEYYNMKSIIRPNKRIIKYDYYFISINKYNDNCLCYSGMCYLHELIGPTSETINYVDWLEKHNLTYKLESTKLGLL